MKKYRFRSAFVFVLLLTICFSASVYAENVKKLSASGEVVNIQTSLLVRSEPSKSGTVLDSLKNGEHVSITGETEDWYRIRYNSDSAYVSKSYISANALDNKTVVDFNAAAYVKVDGHLNVRSGPSMSASVIDSYVTGKKVTITGETADWYRIRHGSGSAFVSKSYISFSASGDSQNGEKSGTVRVNTTLLVREEPSTSGTVIGYLKNGRAVAITGESNGYYQIRYHSSTAYVSTKYVTTGSAPLPPSDEEQENSSSMEDVSRTGYANVDTSLLIRRSPSSSASVIGRFSRGEKIYITGEASNWYRVRYSGRTGYVNKAYVSFNQVSASGYRKISLDVPLYHQYDSRWANVRIGSETLKSAGCVTASLAMAWEYRTGSVCTPPMMVRKLRYTAGGNVYWPSNTTQYTGSNYLAVIYQQLSAGNPVIVGSKYNNGSQHYITVTGYNGNSSKLTPAGFTVNDPGSGNTRTLQAFFARTPHFYKLVYYR
ncbi:MAG: SH3 domain-containing protein [Lachnospiraceae bacterium]|nr:SH3 domain-containing protein [Lachnospiraceae bacterium]